MTGAHYPPLPGEDIDIECCGSTSDGKAPRELRRREAHWLCSVQFQERKERAGGEAEIGERVCRSAVERSRGAEQLRKRRESRVILRRRVGRNVENYSISRKPAGVNRDTIRFRGGRRGDHHLIVVHRFHVVSC